MSGPRRIQLSREKGYRRPLGVVVVDRRTKWGNWYFGEGSAAAFEIALAERHAGRPVPVEALAYPSLAEIREELGGKDLGCWCAPSSRCHADTLLRLANGDQS